MIERTRGQYDWTKEELCLRKLKIDKNVPLRERYPHGAFKKIAEKMKIGDSILCDDHRQMNGICAHINKKGWHYQTRQEKGKRRVWRTE